MPTQLAGYTSPTWITEATFGVCETFGQARKPDLRHHAGDRPACGDRERAVQPVNQFRLRIDPQQGKHRGRQVFDRHAVAVGEGPLPVRPAVYVTPLDAPA